MSSADNARYFSAGVVAAAVCDAEPSEISEDARHDERRGRPFVDSDVSLIDRLLVSSGRRFFLANTSFNPCKYMSLASQGEIVASGGPEDDTPTVSDGLPAKRVPLISGDWQANIRSKLVIDSYRSSRSTEEMDFEFGRYCTLPIRCRGLSRRVYCFCGDVGTFEAPAAAEFGRLSFGTYSCAASANHCFTQVAQGAHLA